MNASPPNGWLRSYAWLTTFATLGLLALGGLVTSRGAGMSVPDWPTSYGYNMFALPLPYWMGGIFYEHTHRLAASAVGVLVVGLTRWLGGHRSRLPLAIIGLLEVLVGVVLLGRNPELRGAGHFLAGVGGVVLAAAAIGARNKAAQGPLPFLGWLAFAGVQIQGLLGGLRVVLLQDEIGIIHAMLGQLFFALTFVIAVMTTGWWRAQRESPPPVVPAAARLAVVSVVLVMGQLLLGATMRHQHAGLAIPDFPLAYGKFWPDMSAEAVAGYNQQRIEVTAQRPITAAHIALQMTHRGLAVLILASASAGFVAGRRQPGKRHRVTRTTGVLLGLVMAQVVLGGATIWTNKAADAATAHVVVGALTLAFGVILCIMMSYNGVPALECGALTGPALAAKPSANRNARYKQ